MFFCYLILSPCVLVTLIFCFFALATGNNCSGGLCMFGYGAKSLALTACSPPQNSQLSCPLQQPLSPSPPTSHRITNVNILSNHRPPPSCFLPLLACCYLCLRNNLAQSVLANFRSCRVLQHLGPGIPEGDCTQTAGHCFFPVRQGSQAAVRSMGIGCAGTVQLTEQL